MKAIQLIARSDAMYCGIAMAVTILELALIATNPFLGAYALELALFLQLIISASLEFYAGAALSFRVGMGKTMLIGFILKLGSAISFLIGFYISYTGLFTVTWCLLVLAFVMDAIGTGCLKSTFRPTYNRIHLTLTGESANYAIVTFRCLSLRLLLPFALLLLASYVLSFWTSSHAAVFIFSTIILCRSIQIFFARNDLKHIPYFSKNTNSTPAISLPRLFNAYQRNPIAFYGYLTGNLFESVILMYAIGLLYQYKNYLQNSNFNAWLSSSAIAFSLYFISVIFGGLLLTRLLTNSLPKLLSVIFICMTISSTLLLILHTTGLEFFIALTTFSFTGIIIGLVLMRLSTNTVLKNTSDLEAVDFFFLIEIVTSLSIVVIAAAAALIFGPDGLIKGFGFGISFIMLVYFFHLHRGKKKPRLNIYT